MNTTSEIYLWFRDMDNPNRTNYTTPLQTKSSRVRETKVYECGTYGGRIKASLVLGVDMHKESTDLKRCSLIQYDDMFRYNYVPF